MLRIKFTLLIVVLIATIFFSACAGGSRGTGVRFNRGLDHTDLNDDQDDDDEKKNAPWHRS